MDMQVLKKKLSVFRDSDGCFKNLSSEILFELLLAWESWDGATKDFYSALGSTGTQMASVIGRAKRYKREGRFGDSEFKEISIQTANPTISHEGPREDCKVIELVYPDGRMLRFSELDRLLEFMKKSA